MSPQDIRQIKKVAFTLIKIGSYALDALVLVEAFGGLRKSLPRTRAKFKRKEKFKIPKRIVK